jgi:hypothetical protein
VLPAEVATWRLKTVEVRREWRNIDVLLVLTMPDGDQWIVCIENKVHHHQSEGQLAGYRAVVEQEFPNAVRRIFIFLTKNPEPPDDPLYQCGSYDQVTSR